MRQLLALVCVGFLVLGISSTGASQERPYINIGKAEVKQSPMAIVPFKYVGTPGLNNDQLAQGKRLYDIIHKDLKISSYFKFIDQKAFVENYRAKSLLPKSKDPAAGFDFSSWHSIGAEFMVRGGYKIANNRVTFEGYLYHVPRKALIFSKSYTGGTTDIRTIGHTFCNDVLKKLTGKSGFFLTRFVVARSTIKNEKEIFIMDWDGANIEQVTKHRTISQSPSWSRDGSQIAYTAFIYHRKRKTRNADLYLYDLMSKKRFSLSYQQGINSGATFDPKEDYVYFRISKKGASDIYRLGTDGRGLKPITQGPRGAMNVEPAISPDGTKMAFSSDRSGRPMIYVMDLRTKKIDRLTFAGVYNSSPAWSPDGKTISFAGFDKDHFDIFTVDADGKNLKRLTSARKRNGKWSNNEYPSFSPDGRFILYSSDRTGRYQLYIVSIDGRYEHRLTFDNKQYYKPQWSPYLN